MPNKTKVAVYGTLRQGNGNNRILMDNRADYLGTTQTAEKYAMYSLGGFPAVTLGEAVSPIVVEVYEVDDKCLQSLDWLEGYRGPQGGNFYDRDVVKLADGQEAFMYHIEDRMHGSSALVAEGDWNEYVRNRVSKAVR